MDLTRAKFERSHSSVTQITNKRRPEFAFIGRSNVGKSSLINALTSIKDLAKTSSKPGKTQLINFFDVEKKLYLVDLPGYGYAKVSKKLREEFEGIISEYLVRSENLFVVFVLIDAAIPPQKIDIDFLNWCGTHKVPVAVVFTKTDKKKKRNTEKHMNDFEKELNKTWEALPLMFETSSTTGYGIEELGDWISKSLSN